MIPRKSSTILKDIERVQGDINRVSIELDNANSQAEVNYCQGRLATMNASLRGLQDELRDAKAREARKCR